MKLIELSSGLTLNMDRMVQAEQIKGEDPTVTIWFYDGEKIEPSFFHGNDALDLRLWLKANAEKVRR
jgi:hypothetical protein